jgi:hypothetical protein
MGAVAAPASATDRVHLAIVNDSPNPIVVDSQYPITVDGDGSASSDCNDNDNLPVTVAAGDTEEPCSLTIDTPAEHVTFAWWGFSGTYQGSPFLFGMDVVDPNRGELYPCWYVPGQPGNTCEKDPPAGGQPGLCTPVGSCPFELSQIQPFLSPTGGGEYGLTWLAPGVGASLAVDPRATLSGRSAKVKAKCNRAVGCRGKLRLAARVNGATRLSTIGTTSYRMKHGRRIIQVPVRRTARRHLRRQGKLSARATVRPRGANGFPRPSRYPLALR